MLYLDDILIYTKDLGRSHVNVVRWVLEQLQKYSLHTNLKKYQFYEDEVWFLDFIILADGIKIEEEMIEAVKS